MAIRVLAAMFTILALAPASSRAQTPEQKPIPDYEQQFMPNGVPSVTTEALPGLTYSAAEREVAIRDLQKLQDGPMHLANSTMKVLHHNLPLGFVHVTILNHALMTDPDPIAQQFLKRLRKAAADATAADRKQPPPPPPAGVTPLLGLVNPQQH